MNQLEQSAAPLLRRLFNASRSNEAAVLRPSEAAIIARFVVLIAWTLDLTNDLGRAPVIGSTLSMRQELMTLNRPPVNTSVWLARFEDEYVRQWQAYAAIGPAELKLGTPVSNLLLTALSFGRVAFFATTADLLISQPLPSGTDWVRIWPSPGHASQLPPNPIDEEVLKRVFGAVADGPRLPVPTIGYNEARRQ